MYTANSGNVLTQGPGGIPVAVSMQSSGGTQEGQPVSGADGNQLQFVQVVPYGTMGSGYQPLHIDVPPSYEEGQYTTQQSQQVRHCSLLSWRDFSRE